MRQPSISACGRFPKLCRTMDSKRVYEYLFGGRQNRASFRVALDPVPAAVWRETRYGAAATGNALVTADGVCMRENSPKPRNCHVHHSHALPPALAVLQLSSLLGGADSGIQSGATRSWPICSHRGQCLVNPADLRCQNQGYKTRREPSTGG